MERRHIKHTLSFPVRLEREANLLTRRAHTMPASPEQAEMLRKARQLRVAIDINEWLASPGLQAPV